MTSSGTSTLMLTTRTSATFFPIGGDPHRLGLNLAELAAEINIRHEHATHSARTAIVIRQ